MIKITKYQKLSEILNFIELYQAKYSDLSKDKIAEYLTNIHNETNYNLLIAEIENEIIGMAAYHYATMLYSGKYAQVTSLYVKTTARNQGVAHMLLKYIENSAKNAKCSNIVLDSFVTNKNSHQIYFREGYEIKTYHFMKKL